MGRVSQSIASESPGLQASRFHARRGDRPERVEPPAGVRVGVGRTWALAGCGQCRRGHGPKPMHKSDEVRPSRLRMLTLGRCAKFPAWGETQALSLAIAPNQTVVHVDYCAAERQLLELLRDWWRDGRRLGVLLPRGWLFPGRNPVEPLS